VSITTKGNEQSRGRVRVERAAKRVRAYLGGVLVADTIRPLLVWEAPYYPTYYIPATDVRTELLEPDGGAGMHSPSRGEGRTFTIKAGDREAVGAALCYEESPLLELRDAIRLEWDAMDAWFEEDEQVFTHPRDPYTRVDILPSSRHVRVEVDGVTVAESSKPTLLFETGLPTRYYLPKTHVRMELLTPSDSVSHCPYKGQAEWWSVRAGDEVHEDLAWSYRTPLPESQKIAGLVAFYNEKVDIYVDGVLQERPVTKFS
jgi:uncharacterized protein (DUF427 family)